MDIEQFIERWERSEGGAERANYVRFLDELIAVLGLPDVPLAAKGTVTPEYGYEARVSAATPHGAVTNGRVDLYRRGHFIVEAKQSHIPKAQLSGNLALFDPAPAEPATPSGAQYDKLMREAFGQAQRYAAAVPADHGWPPFIIVADIGRAFEIYFDWSGIGKNYDFFPDAAGYRIALADLRKPAAQELLRAIWTDPKSIDPRLKAVEVTRKVARDLAEISKYLEEQQKLAHTGRADFEKSLAVERTALFIMRLLFCMFAEDVGLLPKGKFTGFLESCLAPDWRSRTDGGVNDKKLRHGLTTLWETMGRQGGYRYVEALDADIQYFNGGLFAEPGYYALDTSSVARLIECAHADWRRVEPAIFGTLLEQALTDSERARLGAHYTPRPYVERLVEATVMEPLRAEWERLQADPALAALHAFHASLGALRILDPACGTGNFLYVAMELLLTLEGQVIELIGQLGGNAEAGIGPQQFHGLELNPRAAVIAELVLWIGWLRWRMNHAAAVTEPVLRRYDTINFGGHGGYDAVLARLPSTEIDYANPRPPVWPEADFIVGNPPFIGGGSLRAALGDEYVAALWAANPNVPRSADFVMQWWDLAASILTAPGTLLRRFGFVTTNSITQSFSRRVIAARLASDPPLSLRLAVADHPWVKSPPKLERSRNGASKDSGPAAVRIAMTVAQPGSHEGEVIEIIGEAGLDTDAPTLVERSAKGTINADLTLGSDVTKAVTLRANENLSSPGVKLHGAGFIVTPQDAVMLGLGKRPGLEAHIRPYRHGRDLLQRSRGVMVLDFEGLDEGEVRRNYPEAYQHILAKVKPERDTNNEQYRRENWWLFGRRNTLMRGFTCDLSRYVATVETAKHRIFQFLDAGILPDNMLIAIGLDDGFSLGVLSSRIHCEWSLRAGGTLEDRPRYNKALVFDRFPFPDATSAQRATIAELGEELDATRKAVQAEHGDITLTGMYNLVEKLRGGIALDLADTDTARRARAAIVLELHRRLDAAVAGAYGWPADLAPAEIVARLVALNAARAAEEAAGHVRWLRPDYQAPAPAPPCLPPQNP